MDKSNKLDKDNKISDNKNIKSSDISRTNGHNTSGSDIETNPLILCPFGFYNYISYMLPHPDYPDNLDMY